MIGQCQQQMKKLAAQRNKTTTAILHVTGQNWMTKNL
jgi:hypothetical protein